MLGKLIQGEKKTALIGKVISTPATGQYIVEDAQGRQYTTQSFENYPIGASVVLLDGFIIGKAGTRPEPQIFIV